MSLKTTSRKGDKTRQVRKYEIHRVRSSRALVGLVDYRLAGVKRGNSERQLSPMRYAACRNSRLILRFCLLCIRGLVKVLQRKYLSP